jgi:hypothetical protein
LLKSKKNFFLDEEIKELVEGILDLLTTNVTGKTADHYVSPKLGTFLPLTLGHKKNQRGGPSFSV